MANGNPNQGPTYPLTVIVTVDQKTLVRTLTFSRPVTPVEASAYLFGSPNRAGILKPVRAAATGRSDCYLLDTSDLDIIMQMRDEVRVAWARAGVLNSIGKPLEIPAWVPENIKQDINNKRLKDGVTRYKGESGWGGIVVWKDSASIQPYQEFPESPAYYSGITSDGTQARLLHYAYTQFNKDMRYFVETKGISPEQARNEIRRINDEVFKLILEGAVAMLIAGAGITQVNNAIRGNAKAVSDAARRSPRIGASSAPQKIRPVNGGVNVGGGYETPNMTNLNPGEGVGGGPLTGMPNHVKGSMEQMDEIFEPGSVNYMESNKLRYQDVNWIRGAEAAAKVMRSGGKVSMNIWCSAEAELKAVAAAFKNAGFKDINATYNGIASVLTAIKP